jgi:hypothetical protein
MELNDNPIQFSEWVEKKAITDDTTYLDIICEYCKDHDIEFATVAKFITDNLKYKIREEAENNRLYKKKQKISMFEDCDE